MNDLVLLVLALLACLGLSFFFSGSETAIISANKFRLRSLHEQGDASAGRLLTLLANTQRLLVMVLIGNNIVNVLAALLFAVALGRLIPHLDEHKALGLIEWRDLLDILILTPVVVIFAEVLPKALFRARADRVIEAIRPGLVLFLFLLRPLIVVVEHFTSLVLSPLSEQRTRAMRQLTRRDVINLITPEEEEETEEEPEEAEAESHGVGQVIGREAAGEESRLTEISDERQMIHNIIQLQDSRAYEIMTPLVDLVAIQLGRTSLEGFQEVARQSGYSRFPVYRDKIVNLIGYIDVFRVLREARADQPIEDFVEKPHYVPETKRVDDLLQEFLRLRVKNAIVVDEYGGCSGWISREDMLEEIVGELEDELDEPARGVIQTPDGAYLVEGRMEIDALNHILDADFSDEEWETLAGLILAEMGRVPQVGDEITIDGWRAQVVKMEGMRIEQVKLTAVRE